MNQESKWDVEIVRVEIPGKDYDAKLVQMIETLLAVLENPPAQAEDGDVRDREAA